jgi:outer membrane protein assembly factor BamB
MSPVGTGGLPTSEASAPARRGGRAAWAAAALVAACVAIAVHGGVRPSTEVRMRNSAPTASAAGAAEDTGPGSTTQDQHTAVVANLGGSRREGPGAVPLSGVGSTFTGGEDATASPPRPTATPSATLPTVPTSIPLPLPDAGPAQWVNFQSDAAHTGGHTDRAFPVQPQHRWTRVLRGRLSYPLIAAGRAFVTAGDFEQGYSLYGLDLTTGTQLWSVDLGRDVSPRIAYDSGRVFVVDLAGELTAYAASSGARQWSTALGNAPYLFKGSLVAAGGRVYATGRAALFAVSATDGRVLWRADSMDGAIPAVGPLGLYIVGSCETALAHALNDGHIMWVHRSDCVGGAWATTVLRGELLYANNVNAPESPILSALTGVRAGLMTASLPPAFAGALGFFVDNTRPYGPVLEAKAVGVEPLALWTFKPPFDFPILAPPVVVNDTVITAGWAHIAPNGGFVYGVDALTGAVRWSFAPGPVQCGDSSNPPMCGLAEGEGVLLVPVVDRLVAYG